MRRLACLVVAALMMSGCGSGGIAASTDRRPPAAGASADLLADVVAFVGFGAFDCASAPQRPALDQPVLRILRVLVTVVPDYLGFCPDSTTKEP